MDNKCKWIGTYKKSVKMISGLIGESEELVDARVFNEGKKYFEIVGEGFRGSYRKELSKQEMEELLK